MEELWKDGYNGIHLNISLLYGFNIKGEDNGTREEVWLYFWS